MAPLKYSGSSMFRQRIIASILSNRILKIDKIRENEEETTGLQDFEASFLRLIESITDGTIFPLFIMLLFIILSLGTRIEINETGTTLRFKPGVLTGGRVTHDCGLSRSIGWFIEGILPVAPFCKFPLELTFSGITNDDLDLSADILMNVTIPLLKNFGIYNVLFKIKKRGMPPKGGGLIELSVPPIRGSLQSVYLVDEGIVSRVRGTAFCTRVSPTILTRVVDSCRGFLNDFLPDVHITTDHYRGGGRGGDGGDSPGYSLSLVAETTTGVLLSVERTARTRRDRPVAGVPGLLDQNYSNESEAADSPEAVGREGGQLLLQEIYSGGVIDRQHQSLFLLLMVLTPEDVSKVRLGPLSIQATDTLRIIRDSLGVVFRVKEDRSDQTIPEMRKRRRSKGRGNKGGGRRGGGKEVEEDDDNEEESEEDNEEEMEVDEEDEEEESQQQEDQEEQVEEEELPQRVTYLLSCLGIGFSNVNRKVT
jgi:RNA 3'-terminal phosphate cyclase-like protein